MDKVSSEVSPAHDRAGIADPIRLSVAASESAEVCEHSPVPKEWVHVPIASEIRYADDLAMAVHPIGGPKCASERADIRHRSVLPKEGIQGRVRICIRKPGDLTPVVDVERDGVRATQRAQVLHRSVLPQECPGLRREALQGDGRVFEDVVVGKTHDLTAAIVSAGEARISSRQSSKIDDLPALCPEDSVSLRQSAKRIDAAVFRPPGDESVV